MYEKYYDLEKSQKVVLNYFSNNKELLPTVLRDIEILENWDLLMFFLDNPHLESIDFYYWDYFEFLDRNQNYSIDEALEILLSFANSSVVKMKIKDSYEKNTKIPIYNRILLGRTEFNISISMCYLLLTTFEDEQTIIALLDTSISSRILEVDESYQEVLNLILFLKRNYKDEEIINIFTPSCNAPNPAHDTTFYNLIKVYNKYSTIIDEKFIKTLSDIYTILEEFFRIIEENSPCTLDELLSEEIISNANTISTTSKFDVLYTWQYDGELYQVDYLPKEKNDNEYIPGTPASLEQMFRNCISFKEKRNFFSKLKIIIKNLFQTSICPHKKVLFQ